ncbi:hypothetical protein BGZ99_005078 [Dissophora globulifera]|uniref:Uncharacterized protein n=1 Tax=Dissophora globulifera TaxID=979702 RepID=A0A9P6RK16_9FUNG|nr:hypothetical protein BGZ99_005078 [Dissophora globulifera]
MWLHHAPHILFAALIRPDSGPTCVRVDLYKLTETDEDQKSSATLELQAQLNIVSQCSRAPKILCFQRLSCSEDASMLPHLILYDTVLKQLECHRIGTTGHLLVAHLVCRVVSSTSVLFASKNDRRERIFGFDIFEWTPNEQRLLQGYLEADKIISVTEGVDSQQPWCVIYTHPAEPNRATITLGSSLLAGKQVVQQSVEFNAIPPEYRSNLQQVIATDRYLDGLDDIDRLPHTSTFKYVWAQTRSGELAFFQHGILQWSTALATAVVDLAVAECETMDSVSRVCLMVYTTEFASLHDATTGRLLKKWNTTKDNIILADVRNVGVCSVLTTVPGLGQEKTIECDAFPTPLHTRMRLRDDSDDNNSDNTLNNRVARGKVTLNSARNTLEIQLELKRKKILRLQASLTSKAEIIQDCQDLLSGPLASVFVVQDPETGPPIDVGGNSNAHVPEVKLDLFQWKRRERRKRVLKRLIPIVGSTVASSAFSALSASDINTKNNNHVNADSNNNNDNEVTLNNINRSVTNTFVTMDESGLVDPLEVLECAAGWFTSNAADTGEGAAVWLGVRVRNRSNRAVTNVCLSVGRHDSSGQILSRLGRDETAVIVAATTQVDYSCTLTAGDEMVLDRSLAVERLLLNSVQLHYDGETGQGLEGDHLDPQGYSHRHGTLLVPRFRVLGQCLPMWHSPLVDIVLSVRVGCQLERISSARLVLLMQDGLGLSLSSSSLFNNDDWMMFFGRLEEGLVVKVRTLSDSAAERAPGSGTPGRIDPQDEETKWEAVFQTRTESLATTTAKKALMLCRRFA